MSKENRNTKEEKSMQKHLVVVESPAKCKTISKFLGSDYTVRATMGHIIDLPEKEFGVDIANDFKPKYIVTKGKSRILKELKEEATKVQDVYLAPDPDREGEAIAWHVANSIKDLNVPIKRVMFNEITKKAVLAAIQEPKEIDMNKVNAQQARRVLDRIVGYQVSPILWSTVYKGLSAGRVQSVALRLICEREEAIQNFKPTEYWSIIAILEKDGLQFQSKLISVDGKKGDTENPLIPNEEIANKIVERIKDKTFNVVEVVKSERAKKPYPPFITSTLQQEASKKLGFSAAKTMMIAQQLYEGLEIGEYGSLGLITYMRTDSTRIAEEAIVESRKLLMELFGEKYLPSSPRTYGKSKNAQDAHEAIRPSQITLEFSPENIKKYLTKDQFRLYELIWKRFLASQMEDAVFDSIKIDIEVDNCLFRTTGSQLKFDGFLKLYDETVEETTENGEEEENARLPELKKGDTPLLKELVKKQHFTQPPPRYTEASLVKELEEKGIGRPSTYAQIIDTLKKRKYVYVKQRRFIPSEIGFMVRNILVKEFPEVFNVGFTAEMEASLDKIEAGEADWVSILKEFYKPFANKLQNVKNNIKEIRAQNQEVTDRICPACKKHPLVIKWSKNGKFYACSGFPNCRYTESLEKTEIKEVDEKCDKCGAPMVILTVNGSSFLGCSRYPECKNTKAISTGIKCPQEGCNGYLVERKTRKKGKIFYGCSNYPSCKFATWDKPVDKKCPSCGYPILLEHETTKKVTLKCPSCKYKEEVREEV